MVHGGTTGVMLTLTMETMPSKRLDHCTGHRLDLLPFAQVQYSTNWKSCAYLSVSLI